MRTRSCERRAGLPLPMTRVLDAAQAAGIIR
jgi:hypothetical protein